MNSMWQYLQSLIPKLLQFKQTNPKIAFCVLCVVIFWCFKKCRQLLKQPKSLKNKVVLITGGVSGIGRLTALLCKLKGSIVIVWDVNNDGLSEMEELVDLSMKVDVTNKNAVESAAKTVLKKYDRLDVLVNNAGIVYGKPLLQLNEKQIRKCFDVNIISHYWTICAFLPSMISHKSGQIITIGSAGSLIGVGSLVDYCGTKFACRGLHESLQIELQQQGKSEGITFSCVMPYFIKTGMFNGTIPAKNWFVRKILGFDFLEPEYVANEIVRAMQYDIRDLILPDVVRIATISGYIFPYWLTHGMLIRFGCTLKHFVGRK